MSGPTLTTEEAEALVAAVAEPVSFAQAFLPNGDWRELRFRNLYRYITPETTDHDCYCDVWDEDANPVDDSRWAVLQYHEATRQNGDNDYRSVTCFLTRAEAIEYLASDAISYAYCPDDAGWRPVALIDLDDGTIVPVAVNSQYPPDTRQNIWLRQEVLLRGSTVRDALAKLGKISWLTRANNPQYEHASLNELAPGSPGFVRDCATAEGVTQRWTDLHPDTGNPDLGTTVENTGDTEPEPSKSFDFEVV